jgi:hypothetical protein
MRLEVFIGVGAKTPVIYLQLFSTWLRYQVTWT